MAEKEKAAAMPTTGRQEEAEGERQSGEELARRVADIVGPHSGAAKALFELERRRAEGEDAEIILLRGIWLVGPTRDPDPLPSTKGIAAA